MEAHEKASISREGNIYCQYLVGFLDLLGQKEHLERIRGMPGRDFSREELDKTLLTTVGAIRSFRKHYLKLLASDSQAERIYIEHGLLRARNFAQESLERFKGNQKMFGRYEQLVGYFDKYLPYWNK